MQNLKSTFILKLISFDLNFLQTIFYSLLLAFIKTKDDYSIQEVAFFDEPNYSTNEEKFQKLWKRFFKGVTIEERINPKLQQQLVPLIYRTYMSEFL